MNTNLINALFKDLKPDNILTGEKIGNVSGTLPTTAGITPQDVNLNNYTSYTDPNDIYAHQFDYNYTAKNGIDVYMGDYTDRGDRHPGVYHKNLITGEITQLYADNSDGWGYFSEDDNHNVYIRGRYSWYSSSSGILCARGKQYKLLNTWGSGLSQFAYDSAGYSYVANNGSRNASRALYSLTPYTCNSLTEGLYEFIKQDDTVFAVLSSTAEGGKFGLAKLYKGQAIVYVPDLATVQFVDIDTTQKIIRFVSANVRSFYIINYATDHVTTIALPVSPSNLLWYDDVLYISSSTSSYPGVCMVKDNKVTLIPGPEKLYYINYVTTFENKLYFSSNSSSVKGVYVLKNNALHHIAGSEQLYGSITIAKDKKGCVYFCSDKYDAAGIYVLKDDNLTKIYTSGYFVKSYTDILGRTWLIGNYNMALVDNGEVLVYTSVSSDFTQAVVSKKGTGLYFIFSSCVVYVSNDLTVIKTLSGSLLYMDDNYMYILSNGSIYTIMNEYERINMGSVSSSALYYFNDSINAYIFTTNNVTAIAYLYVLENRLEFKNTMLTYYKMLIGAL